MLLVRLGAWLCTGSGTEEAAEKDACRGRAADDVRLCCSPTFADAERSVRRLLLRRRRRAAGSGDGSAAGSDDWAVQSIFVLVVQHPRDVHAVAAQRHRARLRQKCAQDVRRAAAARGFPPSASLVAPTVVVRAVDPLLLGFGADLSMAARQQRLLYYMCAEHTREAHFSTLGGAFFQIHRYDVARFLALALRTVGRRLGHRHMFQQGHIFMAFNDLSARHYRRSLRIFRKEYRNAVDAGDKSNLQLVIAGVARWERAYEQFSGRKVVGLPGVRIVGTQAVAET